MAQTARKKYIVITPFFPSPSRWQGAYVLDQVKAIKRHSDYDVIVFKTHSLIDKEHDYDIDGIRVHCLRPLLMPSYIFNGLTEKIIGNMFLNTIQRLGINPDDVAFVHCHTTNHAAFGFGIKKMNPNAKTILQFHDLDPLTLRNGKWAEKKWNRIYRAKKSISVISRSDLLVCISESIKDVLNSFPKPRKNEIYEPALKVYKYLGDLPSIKNDNIYILNNGVDTTLFTPLSTPSKKDIFRIGCIANFQDLKDHQSLVEAFNILIKKGYTNIRLSLLGHGETKRNIENYIDRNDLVKYIEWPKEVHHDKLPDYYKTLDLFVLPSRFEGFGCVYTEAYACGIPFICCEHQGASECIVKEETDLWLVQDKDSNHLASLIERQYKEHNKQHLCKEIDIDRLIPKFLNFIKAL